MKSTKALRARLPFVKLSIKTLLQVFNVCTQPILLYGIEIWGPYINMDWKNWDGIKIEGAHTRFLNGLLDVNSKPNGKSKTWSVLPIKIYLKEEHKICKIRKINTSKHSLMN